MRSIRSALLLAVGMLLVATPGSASAAPWELVDRASDSGSFHASARAHAEIKRPKAILLRATGYNDDPEDPRLDFHIDIDCFRGLRRSGFARSFSAHAPIERLHRRPTSISRPDSCRVTLSATASDGGFVSVRVHAKQRRRR